MEKSKDPVSVQVQIISTAMMGSIFMLGLVLYTLKGFVVSLNGLAAALREDSLTQQLAVAGIFFYAASFYVPNLVAKSNGLAAQRNLTNRIVKLAFLETAALMGFIVGLIRGDGTLYAIYASLSIFTILFSLADQNAPNARD